MSDLIKTLRGMNEYWQHAPLYNQAADEIERLRKDRLCRCADEVRCEMKAEIERLETFNRANWAALQEAQRQIELLKAVREAHVDEIYEKNAKLGVSYDDKFTGMELGKLRATVEEQQAEIELLQAVVDAAKELTLVEGWQMESYWNALDKALAALEDDDE